VLVSIRRKLSEISRQKFDIPGLCIRSPMQDLTFTDFAHHSERSARGAIPYWSLAKIHVYGPNPDCGCAPFRAVKKAGDFLAFIFNDRRDGYNLSHRTSNCGTPVREKCGEGKNIDP
jgi:hypothetical protein